MDSSRFDAWTRRRFGLAAAGTATTLLEISRFDDAEAKKKRKKRRRRKRCKKLFQHCAPGRRKCCHGNRCAAPNLGGLRCCKSALKSCLGDEECCPDSMCQIDVPGEEGFCCGLAGAGCRSNQDCCPGLDLACFEEPGEEPFCKQS